MEIRHDEDVGRFDKQWKKQGKMVSNDECLSAFYPESRIIEMKDGCTPLGYKSEQVVDLASEYVLAATVSEGTDSDGRREIEKVVAPLGIISNASSLHCFC